MFDACQVGVILRAVLFVETVMAVGAMFGAASCRDGCCASRVLSGGALPATLAWLIVACSLKKLLARLAAVGAAACSASLLGAVAGLYGCALLRS